MPGLFAFKRASSARARWFEYVKSRSRYSAVV
jgi:hypothetical protein